MNISMNTRKPFVASFATPLSIAILLAIGLVISMTSGNVSIRNAIINMFIYVVVVVGLYIFTGTTGVMSFGHAAFMSIGAYMAALMTLNPRLKTKLVGLPELLREGEYGPYLAMLVAAVAAALVGFVIGSVLMRLNGLAAGIATLALLVITYVVLGQWTAVTGGPGSLVGVPVNTSPLLAWVVAVFAVIVAFIFQQSSTGLKLKASREDLMAARASGVQIHKLRLIAFTLSAFVVGMGGALFAMRINVLSPGAIYIDVTFMMLAMLVVGGTRSLTGAVLGVVLISGVGEAVRWLESGVQLGAFVMPSMSGLSQVAVALLLLFSLIFRPDGVIGTREGADLIHTKRSSKLQEGVTA